MIQKDLAQPKPRTINFLIQNGSVFSMGDTKYTHEVHYVENVWSFSFIFYEKRDSMKDVYVIKNNQN